MPWASVPGLASCPASGTALYDCCSWCTCHNLVAPEGVPLPQVCCGQGGSWLDQSSFRQWGVGPVVKLSGAAGSKATMMGQPRSTCCQSLESSPCPEHLVTCSVCSCLALPKPWMCFRRAYARTTAGLLCPKACWHPGNSLLATGGAGRYCLTMCPSWAVCSLF